MSTSMVGSKGPAAGTSQGGGYKMGQYQQYTPEQMELLQQMMGNVGPESYLSRLAGGDEATFQQIEAPAMKQFSSLQGNIASRFSGMGSGARNSSGFQNTMSTAAQDFAGQLQSNRQSLMQQAIKDLHGMSSDLLEKRPYESFLIEPREKKSGWQSAIEAISPVAASAAGGYFGK